jgi:hypothetical protein
VTDEPDIGEAVDYIMGERPYLDEADVWAVVVELQNPPAPGADDLALQLLAQTHPRVERRDARSILAEWRAYASLATEPDWDED